MKLFHVSDVLTATTGRVVSSRHVDGVYDILNFLTGEEIYTHQVKRVWNECEPWLRSMFPRLMEDSEGMPERLADLDSRIEKARPSGDVEDIKAEAVIRQWVEEVRVAHGLPEMVPVYELGADMHTHIDPAEELRALVGDERTLVVRPPE